MNIYISEAVNQLCEYLNTTINTEEEFLADRIEITRRVDFGSEIWEVRAYNSKGKQFKYAWYIDGSNIIADGS